MEKVVFTLEIGTGSLKLVAGYELDGKPVILDVAIGYVPGQIRDGSFSNPEESILTLKKLVKQLDTNTGLKVDNVFVAIPPFGLQIFSSSKNTTIISQQNRVEIVDINNLNTMFKRESIGEDYFFLGVVPQAFIIDDGRNFALAPIGEKSTNITLQAYIHFINRKFYDQMTSIVSGAGLKLRKTVVDAHSIGETINLYNKMSSEFLLVDFGEQITSISLFSNNFLIGSQSFDYGSHHLTDLLALDLNIDYGQAQILKEQFGYDTSLDIIDGTVLSIPEKSGLLITQSQLNLAIERYFEQFNLEFERFVNSLLSDCAQGIDPGQLRILLTGGGSKLKGLLTLLVPTLSRENLSLLRPQPFGARQAGLAASIGLIRIAAKYSKAGDDRKPPVATIERVTPVIKKKKNFNAFEDEL